MYKRTGYILEHMPNGWKVDFERGKITCTVYGEMADGSKVWEDINTGDTYFLSRIEGQQFFWR